MALEELGQTAAYLKAGLLGFPKSGKTYTAALLGIATQEVLGQKGPIAIFDTETGSPYLVPLMKELTDQPLLGVRKRSFDALMEFTKDVKAEGVNIAIIDSCTHPWRELCDSYLAQVNSERERYHKSKIDRLQFSHWAYLKRTWAQFTNYFLNAELHTIICGRAGYEYDFETDDKGRKELVKTGTKMKVESEFGFEPSLLIEMIREKDESQEGRKARMHRVAIVIGDRFSILDGEEFVFPSSKNHKKNLAAVRKAFEPHIELLKGGIHAKVETHKQSELDVDEVGDGEWQREKRQRTILAEEVKEELLMHFPSMNAKDKAAKSNLINEVFGTRSWTAVESLDSMLLKDGLVKIRAYFNPPKKEKAADG